MFYVGLDIGYGQTKVSWVNGFARPINEVYLSGAAPVAACATVGMAPSADGRLGYGEEVQLGGERYAALIDPARISSGMPVLHEDYTSTKEYQALFLAALAKTGVATIDHLVTGLPIAQCQQRDRALALKSRLEGEHVVRAGLKVRVHQVSVIPQAIGAYCAALDRGMEDVTKETALVIDFGHYSVDWVLVSSGTFLSEGAGSSTRGGSYVLDEMAREIRVSHGINVSRERIYGFVRDGLTSLTLGRETVDLRSVAQRAAGRVAPTVIGELRESLRGQSSDPTRILLCGGSVGFYDALIRQAFPRAVVGLTDQPVMANAIGFRVYARQTA